MATATRPDGPAPTMREPGKWREALMSSGVIEGRGHTRLRPGTDVAGTTENGDAVGFDTDSWKKPRRSSSMTPPPPARRSLAIFWIRMREKRSWRSPPLIFWIRKREKRSQRHCDLLGDLFGSKGRSRQKRMLLMEREGKKCCPCRERKEISAPRWVESCVKR
jgi:hypothetical protein